MAMASNCCYSCSQYKNSHQMNFLKKTESKGIENDVTLSSVAGAVFDRLPDEVLIRILTFLSPVNIDDFLTLIALEMVSKRFRGRIIDNQKVWENVTELVIGFHPTLPKDQYLCHIGHATLELFLRRVPKITKIIININEIWACANMMKDRILLLIDRFAEKLQLKELVLCEYKYDGKEVGFLVERLVNNGAKESLEILQMNTDDFLFSHTTSVEAFGNCSNLKTLKLSVQQWTDPYQPFVNQFSKNFWGIFLVKLKSLQVLEITDYIQECVSFLSSIISEISVGHMYFVHYQNQPELLLFFDHFPMRLQTLRLTNPKVQMMHSDRSTFTDLKSLLSHQIASSIRKLEIEYCAHSDDLTDLPGLFNDGSHLSHIKLTFLPYLEFNKTQKIAQLLENAIHMQADELKISIIFKHSDVDRAGKLAIVHSLLDSFDVPHGAEDENIWEFIRGMVCINLKLNKIGNELLICHPHPPPGE